jgi:site-specific DNA recombinase
MNIAVYVRVSTQRQAQTQTIEQQLDSLQNYYETQGWPWQEEHIFRDDGYSGACAASAWTGSTARADRTRHV